MSSDQNQPDDRYDQEAPRQDQPTDPVEDAVTSVFEPLAQQVEGVGEEEPANIQEPGNTLAEIGEDPPAEAPAEPAAAMPPDRPGASSTTGTGTSIAIGCVAVCAVILLITILILTIVS